MNTKWIATVAGGLAVLAVFGGGVAMSLDGGGGGEAELPPYDGPGIASCPAGDADCYETGGEGPVIEPGDKLAPGADDAGLLAAGACLEGSSDCGDMVVAEDSGRAYRNQAEVTRP